MALGHKLQVAIAGGAIMAFRVPFNQVGKGCSSSFRFRQVPPNPVLQSRRRANHCGMMQPDRSVSGQLRWDAEFSGNGDEEHTIEYVVEMLIAVFGLAHSAALACTLEADATGSSIVFTGNLETAEFKRDCVHSYGPDWRMPQSRGSVAALVEPAA